MVDPVETFMAVPIRGSSSAGKSIIPMSIFGSLSRSLTSFAMSNLRPLGNPDHLHERLFQVGGAVPRLQV